MKHFISLINQTIPFGKSMNALGHTAIGIGHWIPQANQPAITLLFADEETIREFREEAKKIVSEHPKQTRFADFTNTMTIGSSDNCLKVMAETTGEQLVYYAASLCTEEKWLGSHALRQILDRCKKLKNDAPYLPENPSFEFKKQIDLPDHQTLPARKISLVLDRLRAPSELVNAVVLSGLSMGASASLLELKLLNYKDANGESHLFISHHHFPVLSARSQNKLNELANQIEQDPQLLKKRILDQAGNTIAICLLGTEEQVNIHTRQKFISLWTTDLVEDAFEAMT